MATLSAKFDRDKFLINQRRLSIKEKYYVYDEEGSELFYVERPFQFFGRRSITVFSDDSKTEVLMSLTQDHLWEMFHRNYTVADAGGQVIGLCSRNNLTSLFRRNWNIMDPAGAIIARARENSLLLCMVRRVLDLIPYIEFIGGIVRTDFDFLMTGAGGQEEKIGAFKRRFSIFDKYVLDLSEDSERNLDRRVALGVAILLDTGEKR